MQASPCLKRSGRTYAFAILAAASALVPVGGAAAYTEKVLHSFCNAQNCTDGAYPKRLVLGSSDDVYGVTTGGGKYTEGLVFKLIPNAGQYKEYILHNFCSEMGCPGGGQPYGLIADVNGSLYGTTDAGGKYGKGTLFKMSHQTNGWSYGVLHNFCDNSCPDGTLPTGDLTYKGQIAGKRWDATSPLYGLTIEGGSSYGTVYALTPSGSSWTYNVVYTFQSGSTLQSLLMDANGDLFGISAYDGKYGDGFLFKLTHGTWKETVLRNFCKTSGCADGANPYGAIAIDSSGNLFGTVIYGGNSGCSFGSFQGCGVAYEYTASGKYKVLYDFCALANCADGWRPIGGVSLDANGNLFGMTWGGGVNNNDGGVAFKLKTSGAEKVLYSFCSKANCKDGTGLNEPMLIDSNGNLFGTTEDGGANGDYGTAFELKP